MARVAGDHLASALWLISLLRGLAALALGAYALAVPPTSPRGLACAVAAYWLAEGLIVLGGSLPSPVLSLNRGLLIVRSMAGLVTTVVMVGLPLERVFGPWQPGQLMLLVLVVPVILAAVSLQILAAIFDTIVWLTIRRHIPGEWSLGVSVAVSIIFGVALVVALSAPPVVVGRGVGVAGIAGGLAVIAGAVRLRPSAAPSLPALPR